MMRQYELVERVQRYNPHCDEALLNKAYVYAMRKHGSQKRASGDPFFSHPLEVAGILTDLRLDDATIVIALLHDTIEDTDATRAEIDQMFGEGIGRLVEGLTKLKRLDLVSKRAEQAENLRKLLLAIADDVRVLLVKLADRLHNMRTLHHMPEHKRGRIAEETMDIYAPLAGRMGMQDMREELEHLAFKTLNPEAFLRVEKHLEDLRSKNTGLIHDIERELSDALRERGIKAEVEGREKRPYSIFRKMLTKRIGFEQLSDIYGFRVIVDDPDTVYRALGVVHTLWSSVMGRFKDYISTPKQNDYRSLHTTVVGPHRQRVELQIRTREMHEVAEYGIAAHAVYKDDPHAYDGSSLPKLSEESQAYAWLRRMISMLSDGSNPEEFLENTKLELFQDQVFCFTPKGMLITLPKGATPIDFAYAVHTDVGNTCVGCKVNGAIMPLPTPLQSGDEVEIIRSPAQVPPPTWESIAVTGKARAAIRRATRDQLRKQYAAVGRQMLPGPFQRAGRELSDAALERAAPRLGMPNAAEVLAAVGRGELRSVDVIKAAYPDFKVPPAATEPMTPDHGWYSFARADTMKFRLPGSPTDAAEPSLPVRSIAGDLPVRFAPDGGAVPGDRIVGILTPGEGITIYPIQSPALKAFDNEPERWLDVRWDIDDNKPARFPAQVVVSSLNVPGSLARIARSISDNDGNIDNVKMIARTSDFHDLIIDLEVYDLAHLNRIINQLKTQANVSKVERMNG
ncbi:RelA/SpoT family protein [Methylobrevis albus]|uniref:GTP pyrophosphokinase rsh n=1 Tax=Methylobrevis albus TaxID=2793297 RepID=A0A931I5S4_9HYPH|nr:bifunctional (p)ppGpp synthetase/guanosine-3',5'-bis(diphosphate) 3'-pyrophosphohydrolase [Methylobrevis albus]MBH0239974.1 bifunctional (p)ppGpp synthetase/guanosine-3',5'-bis(diphosphate) 3'-pyrophosphohydrolase [Methylobrevis albus]